jgi:hypothetical protein
VRRGLVVLAARRGNPRHGSTDRCRVFTAGEITQRNDADQAHIASHYVANFHRFIGMFWALTRRSGGELKMRIHRPLAGGLLLAAQQGFRLCLGLIIFP